MLPTFEKWTFYKGLYGENDGWEKGARNIYSNYNQMRAYVKVVVRACHGAYFVQILLPGDLHDDAL